MKFNDVVTVFDGSYSMSLLSGVIWHENGSELKGRRFRVLATGGKYPTDCSVSKPPKDNNVMLTEEGKSGLVLFTQEQFCRPAASPLMSGPPSAVSQKETIAVTMNMELMLTGIER